jgi:hypothetical protein
VFNTGAFIIPSAERVANDLASEYGLYIYAVEGVPETSVLMTRRRIAVFADEGVRNCLNKLRFDYDTVSTQDLNAGIISAYDVFLNGNRSWSGLSDAGRTSLTDFFDAGGDYVGLRKTGVEFAVDASLTSVTHVVWSGNAIVNINYFPTDSVAAGFRENDYAFTYTPVWFTSLSSGMEISASIDTGDFVVSGFWPDWPTSGAAGQPVIVHKNTSSTDITLIGIDATFRGHPENTFRILANAIYNGLE